MAAEPGGASSGVCCSEASSWTTMNWKTTASPGSRRREEWRRGVERSGTRVWKVVADRFYREERCMGAVPSSNLRRGGAGRCAVRRRKGQEVALMLGFGGGKTGQEVGLLLVD
jgi:hypothetical protein